MASSQGTDSPRNRVLEALNLATTYARNKSLL